VYGRVDFLYEENLIKIEKFSKTLSEIQKKYKSQERLSYLLEKLSEYINKIMEKKDDALTLKKELSNPFTINKNNILHLRNQNLDEDDIFSIAIMLQQVKNDNKSIESISFSYNPNIGDS
jgi:RecG-like helicase